MFYKGLMLSRTFHGQKQKIALMIKRQHAAAKTILSTQGFLSTDSITYSL